MPEYGICIDCEVPLKRKGAIRCRKHANRAKAGTFNATSASAAAKAKHDADKENARLAELYRHSQQQ